LFLKRKIQVPVANSFDEIDDSKMTSLQIAWLTGKNHNDLLKSIRLMEKSWIKLDQGNFSLVKYKDKKGEERPMYQLSKTESLYIATKFNDEARGRLILRWEELEKDKQAQQTPQQTLPTTFAEALLLAGKVR